MEQVDFEEFAKILFSSPTPPEPRTYAVDLSFEEDSSAGTSDFLFDLVMYAIRNKFQHVPLTDLGETHFNVIRDYIRAIGFDCLLVGFKRNDVGEVTHVDVGFCPLQD